jgi:hypothetical protein
MGQREPGTSRGGRKPSKLYTLDAPKCATMRRWLDSGRTRTYVSIGGAKVDSQKPMRCGNTPLAHRIYDNPKGMVISVKED